MNHAASTNCFHSSFQGAGAATPNHQRHFARIQREVADTQKKLQVISRHSAGWSPKILSSAQPDIPACMTSPSHLDQIAERVERLLLRHQELHRTNQLLTAQLDSVARERDSLKSRLNAARARVDALLDRIPASSPQAPVAAAVSENPQ